MATPATMTASRETRASEVEQAVRAVLDPEIPVITIDDLGIVRGVEVLPDGTGAATGLVRVTITPTYSGCPAMQAIGDAIERVVRRHGMRSEIETVLSPAWTTDWMSESGREALRRFGIAPPTGERAVGPVTVGLSVRRVDCPTCGSSDTEELSRFGSTACKALRRCRSCREPFEEFKSI